MRKSTRAPSVLQIASTVRIGNARARPSSTVETARRFTAARVAKVSWVRRCRTRSMRTIRPIRSAFMAQCSP
jgi:hypothetical protein